MLFIFYNIVVLNLLKNDFSKLENCINFGVLKIFGTLDTNNIAYVRHACNSSKCQIC